MTPHDLALDRHTLTSPAAEFDDLFAEHFDGTRYFIPWQGYEPRGFTDVLKWRTHETSYPRDETYAERDRPPQVAPNAAARWRDAGDAPRLMWLGHASFLIRLGETTLLIDPVFGSAGLLVTRQIPNPIVPEHLPSVDAVLLTHGHFDHFDTGSLKQIAGQCPEAIFVTPPGLERYLPKACRHRITLDWWHGVTLKDVSITSLPAQHWHQRTPFDRNKALWSGWFLRDAQDHTIYHSGDTGTCPVFGCIPEVLSPPDVALLPMGAYAPRWFMWPQHMDPSGTLEAFEATGAQHLVPMHWGTFNLSDEPLRGGIAEYEDLIDDPDSSADAESFLPLDPGEMLSLEE